jgi:hypothetical protein
VISLNTVTGLVPYSPRQTALTPAQESYKPQNQARQQETVPSLPVPAKEGVREQLHIRAVIMGRENSAATGLSSRGREAVVAYRSTQQNEERDQISKLLGVDEYA